MKTRLVLILILATAAYRVLAAHLPELANFSPLMALALCGAVYFRSRLLWLVPLLALVASDLWIDRYYAATHHYEWPLWQALVRAACYGAAIGIGLLVRRRPGVARLLTGSVGCSVLFYLATNTAAWAGDVFYAGTLAGWWQALTVGHPEFPPTWAFLRATLLSDLAFTGLFALAVEYHRAPAPLATGRAAKDSARPG